MLHYLSSAHYIVGIGAADIEVPIFNTYQ